MSSPTPVVGTPERVSKHTGRLTREQVVDRIMTMNTSVEEGFLRGFGEQTLRCYLRRLDGLCEPRGRRAAWLRVGTSPAIVTRRRRV